MNFIDKYTEFSFRFTKLSQIWYRITMFLTKKANVELPIFTKPEQIAKALEYGALYKRDNFLLGDKSDFLIHPTLIQDRLNKKEMMGDCDEHAIYWCVNLLKSKLAKEVWFAFYSMKTETERIGHAVCVFRDLNDKLHWCDYHSPEEIANKRDFIYFSAKRYGAMPIVGAMWQITSVTDDNMPVFGDIERIVP